MGAGAGCEERIGNMTEQKKEKNEAAEEKLAKVLKDALAEEIGEIPKASISVEELRELEATDRKKRAKKKRIRFASIAAVVVIVCGAAVYMAWPKAAVPVDADKNTQQRVEEKDGMVIINEGDVEGDSGEVAVTETDWDKVEDLREYVPNLYIPEYVPEGYEFEEATVKKYSDETYDSEFIFENNSARDLIISQTALLEDDLQTDFVGEYDKKLNSNSGDIYIVKHQKGISGTLIDAHDRIFIFGEFSTEEMKSIFDNLTRD